MLIDGASENSNKEKHFSMFILQGVQKTYIEAFFQLNVVCATTYMQLGWLKFLYSLYIG